MTRHVGIFLGLLASLALAACGGGGGGGSAASSAAAPATAAPASVAPAGSFYPNDCHFGVSATCNGAVDTVTSQQWDMTQISAPAGWGYVQSGVLKPGNVKIAVIDTGWDCTHTGATDDESANVQYEEAFYSGTGVAQNGKGDGPAVGTAFTCVAEDTDGHGSNVSGIADAVTNNAVGFAGVAFNAQLYEYRIFPSGVNQSSSTADEAAAINDAVSRGVQVINLSLGGSGTNSVEQTAITNAIAANVTVVAAAGNTGANSLLCPACYTGVISVGATALADGKPNGAGNSNGTAAAPVEYIASYSNYASNLSLVAPGGDPVSSDTDTLHWITNLYSTGDVTAGSTCTPSKQPDNTCVALFAGTSQATPHVTGAAALLLARTPSLVPSVIAADLQTTADNICGNSTYSCPKGTSQQGNGRVNVQRALNLVLGTSFLRLASSAVPPAAQTVAAPGGAQRPAQSFSSGSDVSPNLLYVHYSASRLAAMGRHAEDVESSFGLAPGTQIGPANGDDIVRIVRIPAGQSIDSVSGNLRGQSAVRSVESVLLRHPT